MGKERLKKCEGTSRERGRETLILIIPCSVREREREMEKRLNREMNIKQTEMEGGGDGTEAHSEPRWRDGD